MEGFLGEAVAEHSGCRHHAHLVHRQFSLDGCSRVIGPCYDLFQAADLERRVENLVRHHLAAPDEAVFVGAVVGQRVVNGADVFPDQQVVGMPTVGVDVFVLKLMGEQEFEDLVALAPSGSR